jgi:PAS domain S-box-containing protein
MDCVPALLWITDVDGSCIFCNKGWLQFSGRKLEEELGRGWTRGVHPEDLPGLADLVNAAFGARRPFTYEYRHRNASGEYRWLLAQGIPCHGPDGRYFGFTGSCIDLTERKLLEEQSYQAQKLQAIAQLASGVAHNFNNLLTVIKGYADLLLTQAEPNSRHQQFLREIREASTKAASLTRQLLTFVRQDAQTPIVLDPNAMLTDLAEVLRRLVGETVELSMALAPDVGHIRVDPIQLEQMLVHLVMNARDAMPRGGKLTILTSVVERTAAQEPADIPAGRYVQLTIADTGCGMSEAVRSHLFEPFFTTKEVGQGVGLGLASVYGSVQQAGGHIRVSSEPHQGTTFRIYFPPVDEKPATEAGGPVATDVRGSETILLVEDEAAVRQLARTVLELQGYKVLEAAEGKQALALAQGHIGPVHLLLSDVVMPEMSGPVLAGRLLGLRPDLKIIYISGHSTGSVLHHGLKQGTVAFLQKPFTPEALLQTVRGVLDG